jgi:hypothetical protein
LSLLQNSNAISTGGGYNLESSLRFRPSAGAYLERTFGVPTDPKKYTISVWVKRGGLGSYQNIISAFDGVTTYPGSILFAPDNTLGCYMGGAAANAIITTQVFRDPSAWYHIVFSVDAANTTCSLQINGGTAITASVANVATQINANGRTVRIGDYFNGAAPYHFDGYLTEFNFIDGQALTADDFGEYDDTTGVWKPKEYTGTYGTNGFYLPMKETQQATGFNTVLYTGNGGTQSISNVGFSPDLVWTKGRDNSTYSNTINDTVRGATNRLFTDLTNAEASIANGLTSFDSDGFTIGDNPHYNISNEAYVAWCWDAGSSTVSNTDGTITSSVRANPATGFSIVSYTGISGTGTIGHGLSQTPELIICKVRSTTDSWAVYHSSAGDGYLYLNSTAAFSSSAGYWGTPDSTTFGVAGTGTRSNNRTGQTHIAYCFHSVAGYSKFGSYTGTGASGNSVTGLGFSPAWLMVKRTNSTGNWHIVDNTRVKSGELRANLSNAEAGGDGGITFNSDGFTLDESWSDINGSGDTYIYMAFADTRDAQFNFDASGNKNNWTANNINSNASSETTYDIMNDVATLTDEDTANFATLNPLYAGINGLSASNLTFTPSGWMHIPSTIELPTDSTTGIYWEEDLTVAVAANYHASGVTNGKNTASTAFDSNTAVISMSGSAWRLYKSGDANNAVAITGAGGSASNGDVHMFAYKNGYLYWGINGSWYPTGANPATDTSPLNASQITAQQYALCGGYTGITKSINFGQRPFKYTPPTGYKKLNTYNLPDSTIKDGSQYFDVSTWTGNGGTQDISLEFSPDFAWIKKRNAIAYHILQDTIRGAGKNLFSNDTLAEIGNAGDLISSFNTDGFTVNTTYNGGTNGATNGSGDTFVGWSWRGSDSSPVSNTDGTITSTVSANTDSGFSVVTYTGNGSTGTVGHGLGVAPSMVIVKRRDGAFGWNVYHSKLTSAAYVLFLQATDAQATSSLWNSTAPTSSVFSLGTSSGGNASGGTYVAYCFAEVEGFSKFGSYTGNGSADGPFVYTGFRPAFILAKRIDTTNNWLIHDTARATYNQVLNYLLPNSSGAEGIGNPSTYGFDLLSNGFKCRSSTGGGNDSGGTYIYMAFAENPFKQSLAR